MKAIENTALSLLAAALIFICLVLTTSYLDRYKTDAPPRALGAPEFSFEKSLRESQSLEGVKQMCQRLAENEDDARRFNARLYQQFNGMARELSMMLLVSFTIFGCGVAYIYVVVRRLRNGAQAS